MKIRHGKFCSLLFVWSSYSSVPYSCVMSLLPCSCLDYPMFVLFSPLFSPRFKKRRRKKNEEKQQQQQKKKKKMMMMMVINLLGHHNTVKKYNSETSLNNVQWNMRPEKTKCPSCRPLKFSKKNTIHYTYRHTVLKMT